MTSAQRRWMFVSLQVREFKKFAGDELFVLTFTEYVISFSIACVIA